MKGTQPLLNVISDYQMASNKIITGNSPTTKHSTDVVLRLRFVAHKPSRYLTPHSLGGSRGRHDSH